MSGGHAEAATRRPPRCVLAPPPSRGGGGRGQRRPASAPPAFRRSRLAQPQQSKPPPPGPRVRSTCSDPLSDESVQVQMEAYEAARPHSVGGTDDVPRRIMCSDPLSDSAVEMQMQACDISDMEIERVVANAVMMRGGPSESAEGAPEGVYPRPSSARSSDPMRRTGSLDESLSSSSSPPSTVTPKRLAALQAQVRQANPRQSLQVIGVTSSLSSAAASPGPHVQMEMPSSDGRGFSPAESTSSERSDDASDISGSSSGTDSGPEEDEITPSRGATKLRGLVCSARKGALPHHGRGKHELGDSSSCTEVGLECGGAAPDTNVMPPPPSQEDGTAQVQGGVDGLQPQRSGPRRPSAGPWQKVEELSAKLVAADREREHLVALVKLVRPATRTACTLFHRLVTAHGHTRIVGRRTAPITLSGLPYDCGCGTAAAGQGRQG
jgi:hypothetical protein